MSIVTRGLSQPVALLPSGGLGLGDLLAIVLPLEQVTDAVEILTDAGIAEPDLNIVALDPAKEIVVIEYKFDKDAITPVQRSEVVNRFISIEVVQPELTVTVAEVSQTIQLIEILQRAVTIAPNMEIIVVEATADVDVDEAIDKVQDT
jgi:hypothetical protein